MKTYISSDEAYPVYGFWEATEHDKFSVELTDAELVWCRRVMNEYDSVQEFLSKKQEEQWKNKT